MKAQQSAYLAYLVRLWQARGVDGVNWRASLEDAKTHRQYGFRDLATMVGVSEGGDREQRIEDVTTVAMAGSGQCGGLVGGAGQSRFSWRVAMNRRLAGLVLLAALVVLGGGKLKKAVAMPKADVSSASADAGGLCVCWRVPRCRFGATPGSPSL